MDAIFSVILGLFRSKMLGELFISVLQGCLGNAAYDVIEGVLGFEAFILKIKMNKQLNRYLSLALVKCFLKAQKAIAEQSLKTLKESSQQTIYRRTIIYKPEQNHQDICHLERKIASLKQQLGQIRKISDNIPIPTLNEIEQLLTFKAGYDYQVPGELIDKLLPAALEDCPVATYERLLKQNLLQHIYDCFLKEIVDYEELNRIFTTLSQAKAGTDLQIISERLLKISQDIEELKIAQNTIQDTTQNTATPNVEIQVNSTEKILTQAEKLKSGESLNLDNEQSDKISTESEAPLFDASFYTDCYREVDKPGALIRVKAPLKWGKTYLVIKILEYAYRQGYKVVRIDFKEAETKAFSDSEQLLRWFCSKISHEIDLPDKLDEYWSKSFGYKTNCKKYFEKYILANLNSPLVLGLDDVDLLFPHLPIAHDFFSLLRNWHEDAKMQTRWKQLRLILAYSSEDYIPQDRNQSPFNVGKEIELPELNQTQVYKLAQKYHLNWNREQVQELMEMLGGHPYLIRMALDKITSDKLTLSEFLKVAPTEEGIYDDYLLRYLYYLEKNQELLKAMRQVVITNAPIKIDAKLASKLRNMGLLKPKGNAVEPLCKLYRLYFKDRLEINQ